MGHLLWTFQFEWRKSTFYEIPSSFPILFKDKNFHHSAFCAFVCRNREKITKTRTCFLNKTSLMIKINLWTIVIWSQFLIGIVKGRVNDVVEAIVIDLKPVVILWFSFGSQPDLVNLQLNAPRHSGLSPKGSYSPLCLSSACLEILSQSLSCLGQQWRDHFQHFW